MTVSGVALRAVLKIGGAALASLIGCITAHVTLPLLVLTPLSVGIATGIAFLDSSVDQAKRSGDIKTTDNDPSLAPVTRPEQGADPARAEKNTDTP